LDNPRTSDSKAPGHGRPVRHQPPVDGPLEVVRQGQHPDHVRGAAASFTRWISSVPESSSTLTVVTRPTKVALLLTLLAAFVASSALAGGEVSEAHAIVEAGASQSTSPGVWELGGRQPLDLPAVPGGEFGGRGGVLEVYFPEGF